VKAPAGSPTSISCSPLRDAASVSEGEDNEPIGIFVSNGATDALRMLRTAGSLVHPRAFFTQPHGDNNVYEIVHRP